jgi:leucyl aminopeptidase
MFKQIKSKKMESIESTIVVGLFNKGLKELSFLGDDLVSLLSKRLKSESLSSEKGSIQTLLLPGGYKSKGLVVVGLGDRKKTAEEYREIFSSLGKSLQQDALLYLDTFIGSSSANVVAKLLSEEITSAKYVFDQLKSKPAPRKDIVISYVCSKDVSAIVDAGFIVGSAMNSAKTLVNLPHNLLNSIDLANYASDLAKKYGLKAKIYDKPEIEKMGMTAFLAVNQGSSIPPKLIVLKYQGLAKWNNPITLVGKGLTFDTGGYNIKSNSKNMKSDMGGAATVLGVIEAAAALKLKVNILLIIASTDNMISGDAFVPDDVITAANGKTIEIFSTDAEGRLTLADALWFAQTKENADHILDFATLTGAVVVALGGYTGVFTNNRKMVKQYLDAAEREQELAWELPIGDFFKKAIQGKVADIDNAGTRSGGASAAAAFLQEFIETGTKWVHCDIAGTATDANNFGTGSMVRTTLEYIRQFEK